MKALFALGIFLMFGGLVVAATSPNQKSPPVESIPEDKSIGRIVTYSVFGGLVLVLISWVVTLKGQQ